MKLNELAARVARQTHHNAGDLSEYKNFKFLQTVEQVYDIHISDRLSDGRIMFKLLKDGTTVAWIAALECSPGYNNRKTYMIKRTWTEPQFRNQGIMTGFYYGLYRQCNFVLVSDIEHSPETTSIWRKIFAALHPKIYNRRTHELTQASAFEDIYKEHDPENPVTVFLLEHHYPTGGLIGIPELSPGLLAGYKIFEGRNDLP
jgi:hypothetical protein